MLYDLAKICIGIFLEIFFKDIRFFKEPFKSRGPLIIVCNHPNFFLDAAIIGLVSRRPVWFLGKGTLFQSSVLAFFLRLLHVIPIYRRQDNPEDLSKNNQIFARVVQMLERNAVVVIFPEGVSKGERKLSPIKTGTARIALQALSHSEKGASLAIQPIGITYGDLKEFQTSVSVTGGKLIYVSDYKDLYLQDQTKAVQILTSKIETSLKELSVEIENQGDRELVELLAKLYQSFNSNNSDHERLNRIAENVAILAPAHPDLYQELLNKLRLYMEKSKELRLDPSRSFVRSAPIFLGLMAVFILVGGLFHYLPYRLVGDTVQKIAKGAVETASYKLVFGLVFFSIWYLILFLVVIFCLGNLTYSLASLVVMLATGYSALRWWHDLRVLMAKYSIFSKTSELNELQKLRKEIYDICEQVRIV